LTPVAPPPPPVAPPRSADSAGSHRRATPSPPPESPRRSAATSGTTSGQPRAARSAQPPRALPPQYRMQSQGTGRTRTDNEIAPGRPPAPPSAPPSGPTADTGQPPTEGRRRAARPVNGEQRRGQPRVAGTSTAPPRPAIGPAATNQPSTTRSRPGQAPVRAPSA